MIQATKTATLKAEAEKLIAAMEYQQMMQQPRLWLKKFAKN